MSRLLRAHSSRLPQDIPEELLALRNQLTASDTIPLGGVGVAWGQEHSPLSPDAVQAMPVETLVEFIRSWTPLSMDLFNSQTHRALAGVIRNVVPRRASEFSSAAMLFTGLPPAYVRNLLEVFAEVVQRGENIEWPPVMDLGLWLAEQKRALGDHRVIAPFAEEETWRYVRRAFLDLLERAMWRGTPLFPSEHWRTAWYLLQRFALDPDVGDDNDTVIDADVGSRSVIANLDSVSGKALSLVIRFPVVLRLMDVPAADVEISIQYVFKVVESHLLAASAAVSTFTVIGNQFVQLIEIDGDRARGLAPVLFDGTERGRAAWAAYLMNRVQPDFGALLRDQYSDAVGALDGTSSEASFLDKSLGAHLLSLYVSGALTLADDDLVARFFRYASPALRAEVLWDVSRSLIAATVVPPGALSAFVALWEWCDGFLSPEDLRAFQGWALSRKFDDAWVLTQLMSLLPRRVGLSFYLLVEYLEAVFDKDPQRVTATLAALVEYETKDHEVDAARHAVLRIARRADALGATTRQDARRVANLMTARGFYEFKVLT